MKLSLKVRWMKAKTVCWYFRYFTRTSCVANEIDTRCLFTRNENYTVRMSVCATCTTYAMCCAWNDFWKLFFDVALLDAVQPRKTLTPQGITHILHNFVIALGKPNTNKIYIQDCQDFSHVWECECVCYVVL